MWSGSSSSASRPSLCRARSSRRPRSGRSLPAAAALQRSSWRGLPARLALLPARRRRPRHAEPQSELEAAPVSASTRPRATSRSAAASVYIDEVGERTITVIGDKPRPPGRRGHAAVGGARRRRRRLLHRRRRRGRPPGAACARAGRDRPRAADAACGGRRAGRARRERGGRRRALPGRRPRSAAEPRRLDRRFARRLGAAGRAVQAGRRAGSVRGRLRRGGLLRRRP